MNNNQELHPEVFISFKNSDFSGNKTRDSLIARALYDELASREIVTFFSNSTLLTLGQSVYKKSIDEALDNAKVLVIIASDIDFLNSEWVKYEWESFHQDMLSGMKKNCKIIPYFAAFSREQTPRSLRDFQTFNVDKNTVAEVAEFVENVLKQINETAKTASFSPEDKFDIN